MKKPYFTLIFFVFCCLSIFGDNRTRETEIPAIEDVNAVVDEPLAPEIVLEVAPAVAPVVAPVVAPNAAPEAGPNKASLKIPWWILPIMAIYLLLFFLIKKRPRKHIHKAGVTDGKVLVSEADIEPNFIPTEAVTTCTVNLDEEIRSRACELSRQRHACPQDTDLQDRLEDYQEQDWYDAVQEISALYTARGHSVYSDDGYWWASRSYSW